MRAYAGSVLRWLCQNTTITSPSMREIPPLVPRRGFFQWSRRGAAQFRHPHAFLGVMCNLLQEHYPELVQRLWEAGARKVSFEDMIPEEIKGSYAPKPDDKQMWLLMCRRATMESVLRKYVEEIPSITILSSTRSLPQFGTARFNDKPSRTEAQRKQGAGPISQT